jgi:hypothetical protein
VRKIPKTGPSESDLIAAFEKGSLKSVATKAELSKFRAAARAPEIQFIASRDPRAWPFKFLKEVSMWPAQRGLA